MLILRRSALVLCAAVIGLATAPTPALAADAAHQLTRPGTEQLTRPVAEQLTRPLAQQLTRPLAERPTRLDDQLTDESDVLDGRADEAQQALDDLRRDTGLQLFVVFVHDFSGQAAQSWADDTAVRSDLGDRDALLAVATRDRAYAYSFDQNYPLTDAQLAEVAQVAIEPALGENDWAGAVVAAADGYRASLAGEAVPAPNITPGEPDTRSTTDVLVGLACFAVPVLLIVGIVVGIWWWRRSRRNREVRAAADLARARTEEVAARANALLVELDNELRASEQELALATGQYGPEATAAFTAAVQAARDEVAEAFRVRISLDQETVDDPTRRQRLMEIIKRCETADQRLDAEADAFDQLREIEPRVDELLVSLDARLTELEQRLVTATVILDELRTRYDAAATAGVADDPAAARERLTFAATTLAEAGEAARDGARPRAALGIRTAEEALGQVDTLLESVESAGTDLAAAREAADAMLAEIDAEVVQGRTALAGPAQPAGPAAGNAELAAAVAEAERVTSAVRAEFAAPTTDPQGALRRLQAADTALDRALASSIEAAQRVAHAQALLGGAIAAAQAEINAAGRYVSTRRGAIGGQARTLLAEANRQLAHAHSIAPTDPVAALPVAQEAARLANQAGHSARSDVAGWAPVGGGFAGPSYSSGGDAFLGALLGGILSSGGSGRSRSYGSSRRRSSSWGGGFGGSSSRSRRSGGSSGRRSGGGRSGGGRRGGGGRF